MKHMLKCTILIADYAIGTSMRHSRQVYDLFYLLHVLAVIDGKIWGDFLVIYCKYL
jgi:hypothetical protein